MIIIQVIVYIMFGGTLYFIIFINFPKQVLVNNKLNVLNKSPLHDIYIFIKMFRYEIYV